MQPNQKRLLSFRESFERWILKNIRVVPALIFVSVLLFGVKIVDILTLHELREGNEAGLVAGEVAQPLADMNAASEKNKSESKDSLNQEKKSDLSNVDIDTMTPQKYQLIKEVEEGATLKSAAIDEKMAKKEALEAVEMRVDRKIDELSKVEKAAQEALEAQAKKNKEERDTRLQRLIKIAEGLGPKEAAAILEGVEFPILVEMMSHIKESKAAAILAKMDPEKASYLLSAMGKQLNANSGVEKKVAFVEEAASSSIETPLPSNTELLSSDHSSTLSREDQKEINPSVLDEDVNSVPEIKKNAEPKIKGDGRKKNSDQTKAKKNVKAEEVKKEQKSTHGADVKGEESLKRKQ